MKGGATTESTDGVKRFGSKFLNKKDVKVIRLNSQVGFIENCYALTDVKLQAFNHNPLLVHNGKS